MNGCVLIGGGSGLIGTRLTEILLQKGYQVRHLGRYSKDGEVKTFAWDIHKQTIDERAFDGVSAVINLAGANINGHRWTESYKKEMLVSRTGSTKLIVDFLNNKQHQVTNFINGSAVGYYGIDNRPQVFKETDPPGSDFMAQITVEWEGAAKQCRINTAIVRTGIVISSKGGAIEAMAKPVRFYAGAPLGTGKQYVSWIHLEDECGIFMHILENNLTGVFNATAGFATNEEITRKLASKLNRPVWPIGVPAFTLKIILGEMSDAVLNGQKVSSEKIETTGYRFQYPNLESALQEATG